MIVSIFFSCNSDYNSTLLNQLANNFKNIHFEIFIPRKINVEYNNNITLVAYNGHNSQNINDQVRNITTICIGDSLVVIDSNLKISNLINLIHKIGLYDAYSIGYSGKFFKYVLKKIFKKDNIPMIEFASIYSRRCFDELSESSIFTQSNIIKLFRSTYNIKFEILNNKVSLKKQLSVLIKVLFFHSNFFPKIMIYNFYFSFLITLILLPKVFFEYFNGRVITGWMSTFLMLLLIYTTLTFYLTIILKYLKHIFGFVGRPKTKIYFKKL